MTDAPKYIAWALAALGVTTTICIAIRAVIPAIQAYVDKTVGTADDAFMARWVPRLDALIGALDIARRFIPRVVVGPLVKNQPIATIIGRATLPSIKPLSMPPPMPLVAYTKRPVPPPIGSDDKP